VRIPSSATGSSGQSVQRLEGVDHGTAVLEMPPVGRTAAVGVEAAEVIAMGLAFARQRIDPDGPEVVAIGERGGGRFRAPGTGTLSGATDRRCSGSGHIGDGGYRPYRGDAVTRDQHRL
jgi:hypothetical protein